MQNLALKVQKELTKQKELFQLEGNIPSVEEVFKHYVTHTQASVPVKKKTSKEKPNQLKDKIANTVVYEYLKTHQKSGVRQLALELQKEVPILLNEKVPSFQELYNPAVHPRKILVQTDQTRQRLNLEENSSTSPLLHGIMSKKGMFERRESAGSGSSLTGAADHYRKRPLMIGVAGGTASGKVGDLYIVPGANRVRIDQIFPSVHSL